MITYGSVCSGIEAASVAWRPLGWRCAFLSEIDPFCRAVLKHHFPEVPLHEDFTTIQAGDYAAIDLLVGGTPCQSFSIAGLRGGLADERGNLALEYLRLAGRLRPRWLVWENVPGVLSSHGGRDFGAFLGALVELGYGVCWRVLDAQYFNLAQHRARLFAVGYLGDWRRAAAVLLEPACLRGGPPPRRSARQGVAGTIAPSAHPGGFNGHDADTPDAYSAGRTTEDGTGRGAPLVVAYGGNNTSGPLEVASCVNAHGRIDFETETFAVHAPEVAGAVRRLTPRECERLQGFEDDYTLIIWRGLPARDGPRYRALGNSMAVPVMAWIGERIAMVEAMVGEASKERLL